MTRRNVLLETATSSAVVVVATFVSGVFVARLLGPEGRGAYGILILAVQIGFGLGTLSFFDAAVIACSKRPRPQLHAKAMALVALVIAALSLGAAWILLAMLGDVAFDVSWSVLVAMGAFMAVEALNRSLYSLELANGDYTHVNRERVIAVVFFAAIVVGLLAFAVNSVFVTFLGFLASKLPVLALRLRRFATYLRLRRVSRPFIANTLHRGLRLHLPYSFSLFAAQADKLIIAAYFATDEFGRYLVAFSTVGVFFSIPFQVISLIALPELSRKDQSAVRLKFEKAIRLVLSFSLMLAVVAAVASYMLIPLFYGAAFASATSFIVPLAMLMVLINLRNIVVEYLRSQVFWKLQTAMELAMIGFGATAAFLSNGQIGLFLGGLIAINCVLTAGVLTALARRDNPVRPSALVPDPAEAWSTVVALTRTGREWLGRT